MTKRMIGIDYGLSKVGLSISDPLKIISIPLTVIKYKNSNELLKILKEIATENDVDSLINQSIRFLKANQNDSLDYTLQIRF